MVTAKTQREEENDEGKEMPVIVEMAAVWFSTVSN